MNIAVIIAKMQQKILKEIVAVIILNAIRYRLVPLRQPLKSTHAVELKSS
jgi:hypothetical protein